MQEPKTQYVTAKKLEAFKLEYQELKKEKIPAIARKIDEARQMGDLSENAGYHAAREEMSWAVSRVKELDRVIDNAQIIGSGSDDGTVRVGSTVTVDIKGMERKYTIVGAHDADPLEGRISNESPLGEAFLTHCVGDIVKVQVPAGLQEYKITKVE